MQGEFCEGATQGQVTAQLKATGQFSAPCVPPVRHSLWSLLPPDLFWCICWGMLVSTGQSVLRSKLTFN